MGLLKGAMSGIFNRVMSELIKWTEQEQNRLASEEEILRAIDELVEKDKKSSTPRITKHNPYEGVKLVKVPTPGTWSLFKYIGIPALKGLEELRSDPRVYYTIPCGWETDPTLKFWFICFPTGGDVDEVNEFFTTYDITNAQSEE